MKHLRNNLLSLLLIFGIVAIGCAGSPSSSLAYQRKFRVGDRIEALYAGSWYAGAVVEVGSGKNQGYYKIRYDTGSEAWKETERLRLVGQELSTKFTLKTEDTFGSWRLAGLAINTRESGNTSYREYSGSVVGVLTIKDDGTYSWGFSKDEVVRGRWSQERNPKQYKGPVILENGPYGYRWWINYNGKDETGRDTIYVRSEMNTSYTGFKVKNS